MSIYKYFFIFKLTWQQYLAYRLNLMLEVGGGIFQTLITVAVWSLLFYFGSAQVIAGFSQPEMITYVLGGGVISSFLLLHRQGDDISDDINKGGLSAWLAKPVSPNLMWLVKDICRKYFTFFIGLFAYAVILWFFSDRLVLPVSLFAAFLVLFFTFLAALIHFGLFYIFSVMAFWFNQTWGPRTLLRVIMELASGILLPLSLFPSGWLQFLNLLPFKFFAYVPMQMYLGNFSGKEIIFELLSALAWLLIIFSVSVVLWRRGMKAYSASGI